MIEAILGGTFDPVHLGHLHAARIGCQALNAPAATLLLAARPRHRAPPVASIEQRWRMLQLAAQTDCRLRPSDLEVARPGPSYAVDTLAALAGRKPLVWFIGSDALASVASWQRASELPSLCHFLVFDRPGAGRQTLPADSERRPIQDVSPNDRAATSATCRRTCWTFPAPPCAALSPPAMTLAHCYPVKCGHILRLMSCIEAAPLEATDLEEA